MKFYKLIQCLLVKQLYLVFLNLKNKLSVNLILLVHAYMSKI